MVFCLYGGVGRLTVCIIPVQVQKPVFAMPDKVWRVIVQGGKTSRGPCTPWGLEAGFMDKVPGIKFHLVQFCRVGGNSWHAVAFCCQRGNETRLIGRKPSRVGKK